MSSCKSSRWQWQVGWEVHDLYLRLSRRIQKKRNSGSLQIKLNQSLSHRSGCNKLNQIASSHLYISFLSSFSERCLTFCYFPHRQPFAPVLPCHVTPGHKSSVDCRHLFKRMPANKFERKQNRRIFLSFLHQLMGNRKNFIYASIHILIRQYNRPVTFFSSQLVKFKILIWTWRRNRRFPVIMAVAEGEENVLQEPFAEEPSLTQNSNLFTSNFALLWYWTRSLLSPRLLVLFR